jgi:hypothetical protein
MQVLVANKAAKVADTPMEELRKDSPQIYFLIHNVPKLSYDMPASLTMFCCVVMLNCPLLLCLISPSFRFMFLDFACFVSSKG